VLYIDSRAFGMPLLILSAVEADLARQIEAAIAIIARPKDNNLVDAIAIVEQPASTPILSLPN